MRDGLRSVEGADHRGRCQDCGAVETATVSVLEPPGVAAWTCPNCGTTQEPPAAVEQEGAE